MNTRRKKEKNRYSFENTEYVIGYTNDGYEFYFDYEYYDEIKKYTWHRHAGGHIRTRYDTYIDECGVIHNKYIMMHQLIAKLNKIKDKEIDHINGKTNDNRLKNLRGVLHSENMQNTKLYANNTSGHKGVFWTKNENRWKARITVNGNIIHLGTFEKYEDAVSAREEAEIVYFSDFSRKKEFLLEGTSNE